MQVKVISKNRLSQEKRQALKNANESEYLLTVKEVSQILKTNVNYVYKLINQGLLVGLKLGSLKVRNTELDRFIKDMHGKDVDAILGGDVNEYIDTSKVCRRI